MLRSRRACLSVVTALLAVASTHPVTHAQTFAGTDSLTFADLVNVKHSDEDSTSTGSSDSTAKPTPRATPRATPKPSSSTTKTSKTPAPSKSTTSTWRMKTVTSIQARVQSDEPFWDDEHSTYVSKFGTTFDDKYRSALDTVNTASVEGALMYVQAEGINVKEQSVKCERKNNMQYVVFYELEIAQTVNSVAQYQSSAPTLEYCPFVAMDSNRCTPTTGDDALPKECDEFNGLHGEANLGPCVGGERKDSDFRAPYPNTYWFSYPNSCPGTARSDKTDACRVAQPGGLCPFATAPDGLTCTFAYKILGFLKLDDLVGITSLTNKATGKPFSSLKEFCDAGGVEFDADQDGKTLSVNSALAFWKDPTSPTANTARFQNMVALYNKMVKQNSATMVPLPTIADLVKANPKCYENNVECARAANGCKRVNYYQACEVCNDATDAACVKAPTSFAFPTLAVDKHFKLQLPSSAGGSAKFMDKTNTTTSSATSSSNAVEEAGIVSSKSENMDVVASPAMQPPGSETSSKNAMSAAESVRASLHTVARSVVIALVLTTAISL